MAVHVVDFFNRINLLYGVVTEFCTEETCTTMSGGAKYEYLWCDGEFYKKPTKLSAPKYITFLMEWVEKQINDENVFPVTVGMLFFFILYFIFLKFFVFKGIPFPKNFQSVCKKILTRLFRVFVHVYIHHFDKLSQIGAVSIEQKKKKKKFFFFFFLKGTPLTIFLKFKNFRKHT